MERPYYPPVESEYDTKDAAMAAAQGVVNKEKSLGGKHLSKVYVAKIEVVHEMPTDY